MVHEPLITLAQNLKDKVLKDYNYKNMQNKNDVICDINNKCFILGPWSPQKKNAYPQKIHKRK